MSTEKGQRATVEKTGGGRKGRRAHSREVTEGG